jgi:hypothetical protein
VILFKILFLFFLLENSIFGGVQTGFCTSKNLFQYCGVQVVEFKIDSGSISPSIYCKAVFLWIPKRSISIENCFVCADDESIRFLQKFVDSKSNKSCGKMKKANPKRIAPE